MSQGTSTSQLRQMLSPDRTGQSCRGQGGGRRQEESSRTCRLFSVHHLSTAEEKVRGRKFQTLNESGILMFHQMEISD